MQKHSTLLKVIRLVGLLIDHQYFLLQTNMLLKYILPIIYQQNNQIKAEQIKMKMLLVLIFNPCRLVHGIIASCCNKSFKSVWG